MRDYFMETALSARLLDNLGPAGHHGYGWSWVGGCCGAYCLGLLNPEIRNKQQKGAMYPGTGAHWFFQEFVFPAGSRFMNFEVIGHEQEVFIVFEGDRFRMSPIDTLLWDTVEKCFWIVDYKSAKDLTWTEDDAKIENRMQINLYAYALSKQNPELKVGGYMVVYIDKQNYDRFQIHKYFIDQSMAAQAIEKFKLVNNWMEDKEFRKKTAWTKMATGLTHFSGGRNPYRYICEPSIKTPSYQGCPYNKLCLKRLSEEYDTEFTSFVRYDQFLNTGDEIE